MRKDTKMQFINLTPHTLNIHSNSNVTDIAPSGQIARVSTSYNHTNTVAGINVYSCVYDETYMYQLIFKSKTIKCNSIQEWHKQVIKLERQGFMYKTFKKEGERYKFYYV
jgi:hypothetical protein